TNPSVKTRRSSRTTSTNVPFNWSAVPSGKRCPKRMTPPGRASISQEKTSAPCGPNQRVKCSAFVQTSKTRPRGAPKTRLTTSSPAGIGSPLLLRTGIPLLLAGRFSALRLELSQVHVETIEAPLPEAAVPGGPVRDLAQGARFQLARAPLSLPAAGDE